MTLEIHDLSPAIGAEVTGIDPRVPLGRDAVARIDQALAERGVLLFRDQPLSARELVAFSRQFGALQEHVQRAYQHPEVPEVVMMTNRKADGSWDEVGARRGAIEDTRDGWHSDLSYDTAPAKATVLHAVDIPSSGGNTCFANAGLAYENLSDDVKASVLGRQADFIYGTHDRNAKTKIAASSLDAESRRTTHAVHPAISRHPVTGRPAIFVNPLLTTRIRGLSDADSEAMLNMLFDALDRPAYRWEHSWSVGDTLMWDNRGGTMHTGRLDYPRDEARRFIRTTISGGPILAYAG